MAAQHSGRLKISAKPFTAADGRKFGLTVGVAFLVLAAIFLWKSREIGLYITATIGAALVVGGLVVPKSLGPVNSAWMKFALALSKVTTPIFMSIVYFLVMTPFGIVRRTVGSNPMKHALEEGSYFRRRDPAKKSNMSRQF